MKLSQTHALTWRAIARYQREHGRPPSVRELVLVRGLSSTGTIWLHIQILRAMGLIQQGHAYRRRQVAITHGVTVTSDGIVWRMSVWPDETGHGREREFLDRLHVLQESWKVEDEYDTQA